MLKKFLIAMGVIFIGLVASCTLVAGLAGFSAVADAPKNRQSPKPSLAISPGPGMQATSNHVLQLP